MAWAQPHTYAVGELVNASTLNSDLRDNLNHLYGTLTDWTPTVTQTSSVTLTTATGKYRHVGFTCWLHVFVDFGGAGGGATNVLVGSVPAAVAPRVNAGGAVIGSTTEVDVGTGWFFDSSASAAYRCMSFFWDADEIVLAESTTASASVFGTLPAVTIAAADSLGVSIVYETASASV